MSHSIESILVPTDGSDGARVGVRRGVDLAVSTGAQLHALSVVDSRDTELSSRDRTPDSSDIDLAARFREDAEHAVDAVARLARTHLREPVETAVEHGIPSEVIVEYAATHDIDLIVMGTRGRSGLERLLLGSVAENVLRTAGVPIVLVPPSADIIEIGDGAYDDLLLPTDGSEGARHAVELGLSLASVYGSTIHALYSVDTSRFSVGEAVAEIYEALEQSGQDALETVRQQANAADVSVVATLATGPAGRAILSYGDEHDIDMIVMGTHGRSSLERYLIGSVTEYVVRRADVPVCCVPMTADGMD